MKRVYYHEIVLYLTLPKRQLIKNTWMISKFKDKSQILSYFKSDKEIATKEIGRMINWSVSLKNLKGFDIELITTKDVTGDR